MRKVNELKLLFKAACLRREIDEGKWMQVSKILTSGRESASMC